MRLSCLILLGISTLGCKDHSASPPPAGTGSARSASGAVKPGTPALPAQELPTDNGHDQAWADSTAKTIKAVAPDLTDISCKAGRSQCDATLSADNLDELQRRSEALQTDDSLHQLDARGILLTSPKQTDGKASMTIHVLFDQ